MEYGDPVEYLGFRILCLLFGVHLLLLLGGDVSPPLSLGQLSALLLLEDGLSVVFFLLLCRASLLGVIEDDLRWTANLILVNSPGYRATQLRLTAVLYRLLRLTFFRWQLRLRLSRFGRLTRYGRLRGSSAFTSRTTHEKGEM